ncbi:GIY-YIG nuclease family protein [Viridibacillus arvi]|uniref:GIY-YIG nuclease family protein n=1 Tax=Viridibacillus arvi TaxID=263475 RepID=UPI0034CF2D42
MKFSDVERIEIEQIDNYIEKINYQRGFYKGFNLNRVPDDLEGIYILYTKDDVCFYIGESARMKGRLKAHISKYNSFDESLIGSIEIIPFAHSTTKKERNMVENMFINLLQPVGNRINTKVKTFKPKFHLTRDARCADWTRIDSLTLDELKEI